MVSSIINYLLFKPPQAKPYQFPTEIVRLTTSRLNEIAATYIDRPGATITLVFSHGNAEDLNSCYKFMEKLSVILDVNVVGYDFSGYGLSTGSPSEENCYADIETVYEYLTKERKIPPEHIVLYGRSLGSGPSCYLASKSAARGQSVAGLILHAPFTSVFRVILPDLGFTIFGDQFPNIDRMQDIQCPVFIAHGKEDEVVPFSHGLALIKAVPERSKAEFFATKGMHHNYYESVYIELALMEALNHYLDYHILARRLWMKPTKNARSEYFHDLALDFQFPFQDLVPDADEN